MIIGIPKEIKTEEYRVAATPMAAGTLVRAGHKMLVQTQAGLGSSFSDEDYIKAGASITRTAEEVYGNADMIYHVKEPLAVEYPLLRKDQILFSYLHLAATLEVTQALMERGVTGIAYETVELADGSLPLLTPMSEIAGKLSVQVAAQYLGRMYKGIGKLMGGVPGVPPATVAVIGCGISGTAAAEVALGMGARVIMIDIDVARLRYLSHFFHGRFETLAANPLNIAAAVKQSDVVIGAVLSKANRAPIVVTREMVKSMRPGSVIVDIAIDQGGCVETSHPTSHTNPVFIEHDVIHYCVTNMPGMVPLCSTMALSNATLPYALKLANMGFHEALRSDPALRGGLNVYRGEVTNKFVAESLELPFTPFSISEKEVILCNTR